MKAADIMTSPVVTVAPDALVHEVAQILSGRAISAVPVVEGGRLVGIVSEADLLHRHEIGTDCALRGDPWWLRALRPPSATAKYVKSHAVHVEDIMTREVFTVGVNTPLADVANVLEQHHIKRLPVVDEGRVTGIVSRSDVVAALAASGAGMTGSAPDDDEAIRARLIAELERQPWWRFMSSVDVASGVVTYRGVIDSEDERAAARVAAEGIRGVSRVEDLRILVQDLPTMI